MLRFAIIGAGRIGLVHAATIASHPQASLAVVTDPAPGAAATLAARFGARATETVADVFEDAEVDAVIVGSPTRFHVEQIIAGIGAGKAVLTEKPVDLELARVDECIQAVGEDGSRVMVGFNRRFDAGVAEIAARVAAGEIGPLEQLTIISRDPAPSPPEYMRGSGGMFRDMTIHDFDLARHFLGDIVSVSAVSQQLDPAIAAIDDIDGAVVTLTAASGAVATIINTRHCAAGYDQRLEAFGPRGSLETTNHTATSVRFNGLVSGGGAAGSGAADSRAVSGAAGPYLDFFLERYAQAYRSEVDHFIAAITSGQAPSPSLRDGREALVLAEAAAQSAASGSRVTISPSA